jgi:hypothetical protein
MISFIRVLVEKDKSFTKTKDIAERRRIGPATLRATFSEYLQMFRKIPMTRE